ncbi:WD40/YVTN/BNR-like repeat-containing protein [Azonexus sp. IMCC34842]|uniref:WD40/YVTN/BNR-like repeat-containing protein n=1 Tax=Azonexus sp. IMCC34842 TaxID=3420950 RepID=UPI003D0B3C46
MHHYAGNSGCRISFGIRRTVLLLSSLALLAQPLLAAAAEPAAAQALLALKAKAGINKVAILDAVRSGKRIVAVGERSLIFVSDDEGKTWSARPTASEKSLTSVIVQRAGVLIAAGHSGVILRSIDGGDNWTRSPVPVGQKEALLGMLALSDGRTLAFGGYSSLLESGDGGNAWEQRSILDAEMDKHFYGIAASDQSLVLVGEAGLISLSSDLGKTWKIVPSPYHGSLFGVAALPNGVFIAYGMRGKILGSFDQGQNWRELESGTKSPFFSGTLLRDGRLLLGGKDGVLAMITADGQAVETRHTRDRRSVSRIVESQKDELLLFGDVGIRRVQWKDLEK